MKLAAAPQAAHFVSETGILSGLGLGGRRKDLGSGDLMEWWMDMFAECVGKPPICGI